MRKYKCCDMCDTCDYSLPFHDNYLLCLFPWSTIHSWTPTQTRNFCPHYSKNEVPKVIIGIDEAKGKDFTVQFNRFGFGGKLVVNDEMDDVSDLAKDKAKELVKRKNQEEAK